MSKTHRRNDRWKRDRRDYNFRKSKKFKEFFNGTEQSNSKRPKDLGEQIDDYTI